MSVAPLLKTCSNNISLVFTLAKTSSLTAKAVNISTLSITIFSLSSIRFSFSAIRFIFSTTNPAFLFFIMPFDPPHCTAKFSKLPSNMNKGLPILALFTDIMCSFQPALHFFTSDGDPSPPSFPFFRPTEFFKLANILPNRSVTFKSYCRLNVFLEMVT